MTCPRIAVIANKWWEAEPLVAVLAHPDARPKALVEPQLVAPAGKQSTHPRCQILANGCRIQVWCIQDWMDPRKSSSSTLEKSRVLPAMLDGNPNLVIGFGTCACPSNEPMNGAVVMGSSVFVHDPVPLDSPDRWVCPSPDRILSSQASSFLSSLSDLPREEVFKRYLTPPNRPAPESTLLAGPEYVSTGVVNVTDPSQYKIVDPQALDAFEKVAGSSRNASHETTHGLIRFLADRPYLYVSGVANAVGQFDPEVTRNPFAQNLCAANNAAVALAWSLPLFAARLC